MLIQRYEVEAAIVCRAQKAQARCKTSSQATYPRQDVHIICSKHGTRSSFDMSSRQPQQDHPFVNCSHARGLALVQTSHKSHLDVLSEGATLLHWPIARISPPRFVPSPQPLYQPPIYHAANPREKEVRSQIRDTIMQVLRDLLRNLNDNPML